MATITIPENAVPIKKGMVTKEVYFEGKAHLEVNKNKDRQEITDIKGELYIDGSFVYPSGLFQGCYVRGLGAKTSELYDCSLYDIRTSTYGKVKVVFNKQVTINYTPENNNVIFCIPEVPEIPNVEKLPTSSTLTDTINKNIEVKNKIDACKNKLAYILTSKKLPSTKEEKMTELIDKVNKLDEAPPPIYGVKVMTNNSNPETAVTYIEDAIGIEPAKYGNLNGWADKWPFNAVRLVGFKNGQVTKEINPMNKTKYIDESTVPSDVDVMSEIPKIYWKVNTITDGYEIRISDKQVDTDYKCLAHLVGGVEKDFIYIGAYLGSVESARLRSRSGVSPTTNRTLTDFRTYAQANGSGYQLDNWYPLILRKILYLIAYKNLDSQTALGSGNTNSSKKNTGGTNTSGLYYGSTNAAEQVCFLGIEDFYGNFKQWVDGMYYNGNIMVTPDNKTFNDNASGFKNVGSTNDLKTFGYTKNVVKTIEGLFFPSDLNGSKTTYYSDYGFVRSNKFSVYGGYNYDDKNAGIFNLHVDFLASYSNSEISGRLVYMG